jgi:hypothetical protein
LFLYQWFRLGTFPGWRISKVGTTGGLGMPIYELLRRQSLFSPDEVAMLGGVFEDVLKILGLVDRQDPMTAAVAQKVIELASAGVRDPERLKRLTVQAFV